MSNAEANDLYWVTSLLAEMSKEMATPDADHDSTSDNFDQLYNYVSYYQDEDGHVGGGLIFRMADGRGISVGISLIIKDNE